MTFDTDITRDGSRRVGPWRRPAQMLADQAYDGHTSVHDDATASDLGLAGAPIEGPTHFSQIDPLAVNVWGRRWFEQGCVSSYFQTMVVEGEEVQATLDPDASPAGIDAVQREGTTRLSGTPSTPRHDRTPL